MSDLISRQVAIEAVHKAIFDFFDICDDDEESPMTHKDELLLELNKAITTYIKAVPSAQSIEETTLRKQILVIDIDCMMTGSDRKALIEGIKRQMKEGVVVLPVGVKGFTVDADYLVVK